MTIQSEIAQSNYNRNRTIHPGHVTRSETVTDVELRELLEHFTVSINAQNPTVHQEARLDLRANAPAPRVAQLRAPKRHMPAQYQGISRNITASIIALATAAGIGWLLFTSPGLLDGEMKISAHQAAFIKSFITKRAISAPAGATPSVSRP